MLKSSSFGSYLSGKRRLWIVLHKMIVLDLFKTVISVLMLLTFILLSQQFIKILEYVLEGKISNAVVLSIFSLEAIIIGIKFIPAATFIAILIVMGRMYRNHEMDALASAGVGLSGLYQALLILIIPLSICALGLSLFAGPWAEAKIDQLRFIDSQAIELKGLAAGSFHEFNRGEIIFYMESIDENKRMSNIFVQDKGRNQAKNNFGVITAKYASLQDLAGGKFIVLEEGQRLQGQAGAANLIVEKFEQYSLLIKRKESKVPHGHDAYSTKRLWQSSLGPELAELQRRLSVPLGIIVLSLLAVPLSRLVPHVGVYGNIAVAFFIYFGYISIQKINQSQIAKDNIPVWLSFSWIYVLMLCILLALLVKFYGKSWVFNRLNNR